MGARVWPMVLLIGSNIVHDLRVVWPPEVQGSGAVEGDSGELVDCVLRVLPAGSGEPAGLEVYSLDQLKVMQEVITLGVFGVFTVFYFGDRLHWNHAVAAGCLVAGAFFMFHKF